MSADDDSVIVIGMGSGRCGTTSLRLFLDLQKDTSVTHELNVDGHRRPLPWNTNFQFARKELNRIRNIDVRIKGDIGSYWLPYTEWIMKHTPNVKFLCLQRDKDQTVESFMHFTAGRNHWMNHSGAEWELDELWDKAFPKVQATTKREAIARYWDDYYHTAARFQETYYNDFRVFPIQSLNSQSGQKNLLSFIGVEESDNIITPSFKLNTFSDNRDKIQSKIV